MFAAYVLLELCEFFEKRAGNENDQNPLKGANNTNRSQFHTFCKFVTVLKVLMDMNIHKIQRENK